MNALEKCKKKLSNTESKIGDVEMIMKICSTLPKSWEATVAALQTQSEMMKDYTAFNEFITNEYLCRRKNIDYAGSDRRMALNATRVKKRFTGECYNCKKLGHRKDDCWAPGGAKAGKGPKQLEKNRNSVNTSEKFLLAVTTKDVSKTKVKTIIDSGASDHMFTSRELFET